MYRIRFVLLMLIGLLTSCKEEAPKELVVAYEDIKEDMIEMNKGWTEEENIMIDNYVRRRNWEMITTGTGIRYMVYEKGDSTTPMATEGDIVFINYEIRLLEGDSLCYSSEGEPESFRVAMDHVENGLHEVITYLRKDDHAKVIMPYHRAYGLIGDLDQIPPQAALVYDLEVIKIEKAK